MRPQSAGVTSGGSFRGGAGGGVGSMRDDPPPASSGANYPSRLSSAVTSNGSFGIGSASAAATPHVATPVWGATTPWSSYVQSTPSATPPLSGSTSARPLSSSDVSDEEGDYERGPSPYVDDAPNENFKVAVRVRPPVEREKYGPHGFVNVVRLSNDHKGITICEQIDTEDGRGAIYSSQSFTFDYVYDENTRQKEVYERSAKSAVLSMLQGYNATLIAYGQTGTGKTFTMEGKEGLSSDETRGIIPRATEEIFRYIQNCRSQSTKFLVRASYVEIYNELISDLLKPQNKNLSVRQSKERGVYVDGLSEWVVRSPGEIYGLMAQGSMLRQTGTTKMSERSSRSHAIFIVICETMDVEMTSSEEVCQNIKIGKLNIVDLAGSEKVRQSGVTGARFEETKKINWSLHELGNVIAALTDPTKKDGHIPYRNSRLTKILKDSLGGNCKTTMIACISPALDSYAESLSTLKFANRAKNIKNDAVVNEDLDQRAMLRRYEKELKRLRTLLQDKNRVDPQLVSELEDKNRRAEEDREAALRALQERSWEYEEEKQTKTKLMERIQQLEAMLMNGGTVNEQDPAFQSAMAKVSEEYMTKLDELDKERQVIEEDKAHVERYKQLLLKQRDIMVALTARLNERDEVILSLQEELDAYDDHQSGLSEFVKEQQATIEELRQKVGGSGGGGGQPERHPQLRDTESQLEALRWQHSQYRSEMTERLEERNRQIAQLQDERDRALQQRQQQTNNNANSAASSSSAVSELEATIRSQQREMERMRRQILTHTKDRKALRTILEQRIKSKVDTIASLTSECFGAQHGGRGMTAAGAERYNHIDSEIQSLQTLINASIAAMEGDS